MTPLLGLMLVVVLLQVAGLVVEVGRWFRLQKLQIRVHEVETAVRALADDLDLARTPPGPGQPAPLDLGALRARYQGIAPAGPPVDLTIPTTAKLPADEPGDRDQMEVEIEDARPLSALPPER